jgi:hypothetical protein
MYFQTMIRNYNYIDLNLYWVGIHDRFNIYILEWVTTSLRNVPFAIQFPNLIYVPSAKRASVWNVTIILCSIITRNMLYERNWTM